MRYSSMVLAVGLSLGAVNAHAQMMTRRLVASVAANKAKLKQYSYLQKTEMFYNGELRNVRIARVHFDLATGNRVVVPISTGVRQPKPRGLRGRIIERKRAGVKAYVERLAALMHRYLPPDPAKIKAAMPNAQIIPGGGNPRLVLSSYVKAGDKVTFALNRNPRKLDQISVLSSLDDDPVSFVVHFASLADGTNYPATTTMKSDVEKLQVRVTTSNYRK
jgi:hypothetical protein